MTRTRQDIFTSSDGQKFFTREECTKHELLSLFKLPPEQEPHERQHYAVGFVMENAAVILGLLKPERKPRAEKPKRGRPVKTATTVTA